MTDEQLFILLRNIQWNLDKSIESAKTYLSGEINDSDIREALRDLDDYKDELSEQLIILEKSIK